MKTLKDAGLQTSSQKMVAKVCALFLTRVRTGGSEMSISKTDVKGVGRGNNVMFPVNFAKFASNRAFFKTKNRG